MGRAPAGVGHSTNNATGPAIFSDGLLFFTALTLATGRFTAFHTLPNTPHILLPRRHQTLMVFGGET